MAELISQNPGRIKIEVLAQGRVGMEPSRRGILGLEQNPGENEMVCVHLLGLLHLFIF